MKGTLRRDAEAIVRSAIEAVKPDAAVKRGLQGMELSGNIYLVAVGKAAWQMAKAALEELDTVSGGVVITKYGHVPASLPGITCYEAGHPVPDENGMEATRAALALTAGLTEGDTVLFLLSGGGSALFEQPLIPAEELQAITKQLLSAGADIVQINTIRKRLSGVKGGRFAIHCAPAKVRAIILSDILGDPLDMIASGPAAADLSTCQQALRIARTYDLTMSEAAWNCLNEETPKQLENVESLVIGSVRQLCAAAEEACRNLGYDTVYLTDQLCCQAREAGSFLASIARSNQTRSKTAFIAGGETVVHVTGSGKGGRNQELALSAAVGLAGIPNTCVMSVGSDGTDGPTDAAGGYADGQTLERLREKGLDIAQMLADNNAYAALQAVDGLIFTGPTGTNVNDISIVLIE